jgi:hypothetical protein
MRIRGNKIRVLVLTAALWYSSTKTALAVDMFCPSKAGVGPRINTALGCIPVKIDELVVTLLPYLFGIAGGISFLLMISGFIKMTTSNGDPKAVQGAQESITSAITGLIVSIFALFILRLIAVKILVLPGI